MANPYLKTAVAHRFARAVTLNPANIPDKSTSVETFTVNGLRTDMAVWVHAPNLETGVKVVAARVSAKNELELTFENFTEADVNPASQVFHVIGD